MFSTKNARFHAYFAVNVRQNIARRALLCYNDAMDDLKLTVARNLADCRRAAGLTQLQLAEKLNYSDKAVSKWERGESLPDVAVLCELAKMYGVTLDYLVSGHGEKRPAPAAGKRRRRLLVTAMSCLLVWFLATLVFSFLYFFGADLPRRWLSFVWAMPVSGIVLVVFAALWGNRVLRTLAVSFLIWAVALAIYLTFVFPYSWLLFVVGVPLQVLAVFWFLLRVPRAKK